MSVAASFNVIEDVDADDDDDDDAVVVDCVVVDDKGDEEMVVTGTVVRLPCVSNSVDGIVGLICQRGRLRRRR